MYELMISFSKILKEVLLERITFASLYRGSESGRRDRGHNDVRAKSMRVMSMDQTEAWTFSYKSNPSTTGHRWHGYVHFMKENVSQNDDPTKIECMVDCDCPDYRYRYAYNNAKAGAGRIGKHPDWRYGNDNNGQKPKPRSQGGVGDYGVGLCKHLCALGEFLSQKVTSDAPEPEDKAPMPKKKTKPPVPTTTPKPSPLQKPQTVKAPDPEDDSYTDSRTGSDTLQEYMLPQPVMRPAGYQSNIYKKMEQFVRENPEFDVEYED